MQRVSKLITSFDDVSRIGGAFGEGTSWAKQLTPRERQIVELLATEALGDREIAKRLGIKDTTVRRLVSNIMMKLGCENRTMIVVRVWKEALDAQTPSGKRLGAGSSPKDRMARARETAMSLLNELEEEALATPRDAATLSVIRMLCRMIVSACDEASTKVHSFIALVVAASVTRIKRASSRLISATDPSLMATIGGHVVTAGQFLIVAAVAGALMGPAAIATRGEVGVGRATLTPIGIGFSSSTEVLRASRDRARSPATYVWSNSLGTPTAPVRATHRSRVKREPKRIVIERSVELDVAMIQGEWQTSKFTMHCAETSIVATTFCFAYDTAFPSGSPPTGP